MEFFTIFLNPGFWFSLIRSSTPLIFAGMAALIASRSGITNMAIEGSMTLGALAAVVASWYFQNAWLGLLASVLVGISIALFLAYFKLKMMADEILVAIEQIVCGEKRFGSHSAADREFLRQVEVPDHG